MVMERERREERGGERKIESLTNSTNMKPLKKSHVSNSSSYN